MARTPSIDYTANPSDLSCPTTPPPTVDPYIQDPDTSPVIHHLLMKTQTLHQLITIRLWITASRHLITIHLVPTVVAVHNKQPIVTR